MPSPLLLAGAVGVALLGINRAGTSPAPTQTPQGPLKEPSGPLKPPKAPKRCEPADTWFEESAGFVESKADNRAESKADTPEKQAAYAAAKDAGREKAFREWNKLSCNEKQAIMLGGPVALTAIILGKGFSKAKKAAEDAAKQVGHEVNKTINGAKKAVGKLW